MATMRSRANDDEADEAMLLHETYVCEEGCGRRLAVVMDSKRCRCGRWVVPWPWCSLLVARFEKQNNKTKEDDILQLVTLSYSTVL